MILSGLDATRRAIKDLCQDNPARGVTAMAPMGAGGGIAAPCRIERHESE